MALPTPFHEVLAPLCESYAWKEWAGYHAVKHFEHCHEREYQAFRHSVGLIDLMPLYKYKISGADARKFLSFVLVRDVHKVKPGRVIYTCWCDDDGHVMDDGTIMCVNDTEFYLTAAVPSYSWLHRTNVNFDVEITDVTEDYAILGVQGPYSRELLTAIGSEKAHDLRFFGFVEEQLQGIKTIISRTGYTGDLGYELWIDPVDVKKFWDIIHPETELLGGRVCGLDALDITRVEAGFIMNGVDYISANECIINARKSTPYEIGLGWSVRLDRDTFMGQDALIAASKKKQKWQTVGIEYDWEAYEKLFSKLGLPPELSTSAWRSSIPIYDSNRYQIGYATSGTWSPILKKNIAIATIQANYKYSTVHIETKVEHQRKTVPAKIVEMPFFNPERKKA